MMVETSEIQPSKSFPRIFKGRNDISYANPGKEKLILRPMVPISRFFAIQEGTESKPNVS